MGPYTQDMSTELVVEEYINVVEQALKLDCNVPTTLALLPRGFDRASTKDELFHESSSATVRTLWRNGGVEETPLEKDGEKFFQIGEHSFQEWIAPTIFVSFALVNQNPHLVSLALGVISNYLTDFFKGFPEPKIVRFEIVVETKEGEYRKVRYRGPVSGLSDMVSIVEKVSKGER